MTLELTEEQIRINELKERFDKLNFPRQSLSMAGIDEPNIKYFRNVKLPKMENPDFETWEQNDTLLTAQANEREEKILRRNKGSQIRKISEELIDIVIGYNIDFDIQLSDSYPEIASLVMGYYPFRAKKLIEAIETDDALITKLKNELLEVYNAV